MSGREDMRFGRLWVCGVVVVGVRSALPAGVAGGGVMALSLNSGLDGVLCGFVECCFIEDGPGLG